MGGVGDWPTLRETPSVAAAVLRAVHSLPGCHFWPDSLPCTYAALDHVRGHRQVTDANLAGLAACRPDPLLATLDESPARDLPELTTPVPPSGAVPSQRR